MNLIHLEAKEFSRYIVINYFHCNLGAVAMKHAADPYYCKEAWCQIWTLYDLS